MDRLNEMLHELGISKVKLAKFLGVSRQMIYNYLELDDLNKWPKDKKVLLFNLLDIKSAEELDSVKIDTDYIIRVESRLNDLVSVSSQTENKDIYDGLDAAKKQLLNDIIFLIKEDLEDDNSGEEVNAYKYVYNFLQTMKTTNDLKYVLAYFAKISGFVKPNEFVFNEEDQFYFESVMFSAMTLYNNRNTGATISKNKLVESHKRFADQIEHKMEEKMGRTMELNSIKAQALKELNYDKITDENANEVWYKMAEIESRKF